MEDCGGSSDMSLPRCDQALPFALGDNALVPELLDRLKEPPPVHLQLVRVPVLARFKSDLLVRRRGAVEEQVVLTRVNSRDDLRLSPVELENPFEKAFDLCEAIAPHRADVPFLGTSPGPSRGADCTGRRGRGEIILRFTEQLEKTPLTPRVRGPRDRDHGSGKSAWTSVD